MKAQIECHFNGHRHCKVRRIENSDRFRASEEAISFIKENTISKNFKHIVVHINNSFVFEYPDPEDPGKGIDELIDEIKINSL